VVRQLSPRVLVLEDDDQVRSVVTETLSGHGMRVDTAGDGLTALEKIDAGDFDLIIADVRLPGGIDGLDTVRCARARHPCLRSLFETIRLPEASRLRVGIVATRGASATSIRREAHGRTRRRGCQSRLLAKETLVGAQLRPAEPRNPRKLNASY
jgi:CheY-like chemotaxis protein